MDSRFSFFKGCMTMSISLFPHNQTAYKSAQRLKYKKDQLTAEQIRRLEAIGMLWSANEERWQTGFLHAKEYKSVYGDTDILSSYISPDGYRLGDWSRAQKRSFKNGALSTERQQKLSDLGFQL